MCFLSVIAPQQQHLQKRTTKTLKSQGEWLQDLQVTPGVNACSTSDLPFWGVCRTNHHSLGGCLQTSQPPSGSTFIRLGVSITMRAHRPYTLCHGEGLEYLFHGWDLPTSVTGRARSCRPSNLHQGGWSTSIFHLACSNHIKPAAPSTSTQVSACSTSHLLRWLLWYLWCMLGCCCATQSGC